MAFTINNPNTVPLVDFDANFENKSGNISLSIPIPESVTVATVTV
jgi:hypothetical protein